MFGKNETHVEKGPIAFIWIAVLIIAAAGILVFFASDSADTESSFTHLILVIAGILALLSALAGVALALQHHGLAKHEHALGLPKGSVRAILALGLLLVFLGLAVFLYTTLSEQVPVAIADDQIVLDPGVDKLPDGVFAIQVADKTGKPIWKLYSVRGDEVSADLAQQIFTTIATVLVTIIGFYFGNKSLTPFDTRAGLRDEEKTLSVRVREAATAASTASKQAEGAVTRAKDARDDLGKLQKKTENNLKKMAIKEELKALDVRVGKLDGIIEKANDAAQAAATNAESAIAEADAKKAEALAATAEHSARRAKSAAGRALDIAKFAEATVKRLSREK